MVFVPHQGQGQGLEYLNSSMAIISAGAPLPPAEAGCASRCSTLICITGTNLPSSGERLYSTLEVTPCDSAPRHMKYLVQACCSPRLRFIHLRSGCRDIARPEALKGAPKALFFEPAFAIRFPGSMFPVSFFASIRPGAGRSRGVRRRSSGLHYLPVLMALPFRRGCRHRGHKLPPGSRCRYPERKESLRPFPEGGPC